MRTTLSTHTIWQTLRFTCLAFVAIAIAGCLHNPPIKLVTCGYGTIETLVGGERFCVVAPLSCGDGTQEQASGGERECLPEPDPDILTCGEGTYELEQAAGGERECIDPPATAPTCDADEVAYVKEDGNIGCRPNIVCGDGTYEQASGGERECVPDGSVSQCGSGTQEQASGGERECR